MPVQVTRNGLRTIALGTGLINRLELPHLPNNADIEPGDLLVTSGLGGIFPKGIVIGTVEKVTKEDYGIYQDADVQTSVDLIRFEEVALLSVQELGGQALMPDVETEK